MHLENLENAGAVLEGKGGGYFVWEPVQEDEPRGDKIGFRASARTDWFEARVAGEVSVSRVESYLSELDDLLAFNRDEVGFINEYGNVDFTARLGSRGDITIEGVLIKSMGEDSRVEFELLSDVQSLKRFKDRLYRLVKQHF